MTNGNHKLDIEQIEKKQSIFLKFVNLFVGLFCKPNCGPCVDTWSHIGDSRVSSESSEEHN